VDYEGENAMSHRAIKFKAVVALTILMAAANAFGQTSAFTYQGKLSDNGSPANGAFDLQFKLFDNATVGSGSQQGSTITRPSVQVASGIFTVQLDFGSTVFVGPDRYVEIGVRPAGSANPYTVLAPRQQVTSMPYSIRSNSAATADTAATSVNATQLGGIAPSGFLQNTTSPQVGTNFNIGGDGTLGGTLSANVVNAATQYNIGGSRVLTASGTFNTFVGMETGQQDLGSQNTFVGMQAGKNNRNNGNTFVGYIAGRENTTGSINSFFGLFSGWENTQGNLNSFFGAFSGSGNRTGSQNAYFGVSSGGTTNSSDNAFFGYDTGNRGSSGDRNSFFGSLAGRNNNTGSQNVFAGYTAGSSNTSGFQNTFLGNAAGSSNTTGLLNTFLGSAAGSSNTTESGNTFIGANANGLAGITNATAIGSAAQVTQSNSLILGTMSGAGTKVGIGITAPAFKLHVVDPASTGLRVQTNSTGGTVASFGGNGDFQIDSNGTVGGRFIVKESGNVGIGNENPTSKLHVNGNATISGSLSKGGGSFKIDHPLDPRNKFLYHSFVESPDMMNIYNGVVRLNRRGEAVIALPDWFESLNKDFRYQLTCIGGFAPVFVAQEIKHNRFKIAGGKARMRVSWQVTGIRHDAYANKHRITVEEQKPASERGSYLHPDAFPNGITRERRTSATPASRGDEIRQRVRGARSGIGEARIRSVRSSDSHVGLSTQGCNCGLAR